MESIINSNHIAYFRHTCIPPKTIPKLSSKVTLKDTELLQNAINNNSNRKEAHILRILLAEVYKVLGNQKCIRILTQINPQVYQGSILIIQAKLRIAGIINDSFDYQKIDTVRNYINELNFSPDCAQPVYKNKLEIAKAGFEALRKNYYKSAIGYLNASKDEFIANDGDERVYLVEKAIAMSLLAEKNQELHQLICQLYVNSCAKKSSCYPLVAKLYSECMIDSNDMEPIRKLFPFKFDKKDSDNISLLNKVIFKHNMMPIMKCFSAISLQALSQFINIKSGDLLLMIQKSLTSKQVEVDQGPGYSYVKEDPYKEQTLMKNFFDNLENLSSANNQKFTEKPK